MHAISTLRYDAANGKEAPYYRLKESYRDVHGHVHSLILLNIGFEPSLTPRHVHRIANFLSDRFENRDTSSLFNSRTDCLTDIEHAWAEKFWRRMIDEGHIDRFNRKEDKAREEARRYVDLHTVEHTDARNVGAEWLCKQAIDRLDIEGFLRGKGWKEESIHAALAHLIVRTVYAPSEWATHHIMRDNSAACELYSGRQGWTPGVNALYDIPDKLFALKDELETHLCSRTDHLFNLENSIVLFDLTNFYFEGRKAQSRKAAFGRSKEKRSDCRLLVLALCVNAEGFIRYSSILEGNAADPTSLPDMVRTLSAKSGDK